MIEITLPDGTVRSFEEGITPMELQKILAKDLQEMLFLQVSIMKLLKPQLH